MTDGDNHAGRRQFFDEGKRTVLFGCQRHQSDVTAGRVLKPAKFIPIRRPHERTGMSAVLWPILRRNIRPFQMETRHCTGNFGVGFASAANSLKAVQ